MDKSSINYLLDVREWYVKLMYNGMALKTKYNIFVATSRFYRYNLKITNLLHDWNGKNVFNIVTDFKKILLVLLFDVTLMIFW